MMKQFHLDISGHTDLGTARELNEDSCITALGQKGTLGGVRALLAVSDGMGGHDAGDVASKIACEFLEHLFGRGNYVRFAQEWEIAADDYPALLKEAFHCMNRKIIDRARSFNLLRTMGCTCVVCLVVYDDSSDQWKLIIGNLGDSRCYLVRKGEIMLATEDDSVVWQLYKKKEITYAEMRMHPKRNVLTQALGIQDSIRPRIHTVDLQENDALILCSDGLHATVSEEEIKRVILLSEGADEAARTLTDLGNQLGTRDNVSAAVAYCGGEQSGKKAGSGKRIVRSLMTILPIVTLGVGSAVFLNSSAGNPEPSPPPHSLSIRSVPSRGSADSVVVEFSLQPYSLITRSREHYSIVRTANSRSDTIPLGNISEVSKNLFQIPCRIPGDSQSAMRLTLFDAVRGKALFESMLMVDSSPHRESPVSRGSNTSAGADRPSGTSEQSLPVSVARGHDGFLQLSVEKSFDLRGEATAEVSTNGIVEILTLTKQNKVLPKSTSIEYRSGDSVHIRLLGTQYSWTTKLP